jgi:hypothetical protein
MRPRSASSLPSVRPRSLPPVAASMAFVFVALALAGCGDSPNKAMAYEVHNDMPQTIEILFGSHDYDAEGQIVANSKTTFTVGGYQHLTDGYETRFVECDPDSFLYVAVSYSGNPNALTQEFENECSDSLTRFILVVTGYSIELREA